MPAPKAGRARAVALVVLGVDVRQLERSLRTAGYDPDREIAIDRSWDPGTTAAVKRWQKAPGLDQSGAIELGRIVFLPGTRRVATKSAAVGGSSRSAVMTTTSTRPQITVALKTTKSTVARQDTRVTVVLPSDERFAGASRRSERSPPHPPPRSRQSDRQRTRPRRSR